MRRYLTPGAMQGWADEQRHDGHRIAIVPTMGALHVGHLKLIEIAHEHADKVVVSIFVNPIQFNQSADFAKYPRTLDEDAVKCADAGVDALYLPTADMMYPDGYETYVHPGPLADPLCGGGRPGHFRGVTTVVTKLFNAAKPHSAVFGQKDFQQLAIIRRMARDLDTGITIVEAATVREADGLAMSSRNARLSRAERFAARCVPDAINAATAAVADGERAAAVLAGLVGMEVGRQPMARVEYIDLRDPDTLQPVYHLEGPTLLAVAIWIGDVRLIDNIVFSPATCAVGAR
jgi:pantoate--beta-alanine ligase